MSQHHPKSMDALIHIQQAVSAHQIPDLTLLKSLFFQRQCEHRKQINALLMQQQQCLVRGEVAASAMYQRYKFKTDSSEHAFDMNAYENSLQLLGGKGHE
ncbi:hypothetical protein CBF23_003135 [Marinomonas agarivorans]|nr:hypothetical protein CBF23_003135 [Marinomonas agarivorans]